VSARKRMFSSLVSVLAHFSWKWQILSGGENNSLLLLVHSGVPTVSGRGADVRSLLALHFSVSFPHRSLLFHEKHHDNDGVMITSNMALQSQ
jgi:hypothetical protein